MVIFSTFDGQIRSILDGSKDPTLHVAVRAVCMCVCVCVRVCQGGWSSCWARPAISYLERGDQWFRLPIEALHMKVGIVTRRVTWPFHD